MLFAVGQVVTTRRSRRLAARRRLGLTRGLSGGSAPLIALVFVSAEDSAMREQPAGSITLVFTDIDGSTRLLRELGEEAYRDALAEHRRIVRDAFAAGYEVDEEGDAFFYAFPTAGSAVAAVEQAVRGARARADPAAGGDPHGRADPRPAQVRRARRVPRGAGDGRWPRRPGAAERVDAGAARRRGARTTSASTG